MLCRYNVVTVSTLVVGAVHGVQKRQVSMTYHILYWGTWYYYVGADRSQVQIVLILCYAYAPTKNFRKRRDFCWKRETVSATLYTLNFTLCSLCGIHKFNEFSMTNSACMGLRRDFSLNYFYLHSSLTPVIMHGPKSVQLPKK